MTPGEQVSTFLHACASRDFAAALPLLAEDVEYDNVPMSKVVGPVAVQALLEGFFAAATDIEWVTHRQAETGPLVLNERTDRFHINGRWIEVPVAGVFEVHEGRITLWRDYFDVGMFTSQMEADT